MGSLVQNESHPTLAKLLITDVAKEGIATNALATFCVRPCCSLQQILSAAYWRQSASCAPWSVVPLGLSLFPNWSGSSKKRPIAYYSLTPRRAAGLDRSRVLGAPLVAGGFKGEHQV